MRTVHMKLLVMTATTLIGAATFAAATASATPQPSQPSAMTVNVEAGQPRIVSKAPEDSWWQYKARQRRTWLSAGAGADLSDFDGVPDSTNTFGGTLVQSVRVGHWVRPWMALEVIASSGNVRESGLFGGGSLRAHQQSLLTGVRFALPTFISPVLAANVGVKHVSTDWSTNDGVLFQKGTPTPLATGYTKELALVARAEAGVSVSRGPFSVTALAGFNRTLASDVDTVVETGSLGDTKLATREGFRPQYRVMVAWRM